MSLKRSEHSGTDLRLSGEEKKKEEGAARSSRKQSSQTRSYTELSSLIRERWLREMLKNFLKTI